jgi:hypothetical protein
MAVNVFSQDNESLRLKIKDLLDARDMYHVHLSNKKNVVSTAVGLYRIRKTDPWPDRKGNLEQVRSKTPKVAKTLENSEVRFYSWPCILVFVDHWITEGQFGGRTQAEYDDRIPDTVYLPDGRKVPLCVVQADLRESEAAPAESFVFPENYIGGGFPVLTDVQEKEYVASVGCLVTDGHKVFALTNRHVCGEAGEILYTIRGGNKVRIGRSSPHQITRKAFTEVYPGWAGRDTYVNMDAGLIDIDDVNSWTSQVYGVGAFEKVMDLSNESISLKLIGSPLRAYGCASHDMRGEIIALFHRYKSEGGCEYVSDFLIGPRAGGVPKFSTHHGDSGTVWFLDRKGSEPMPVAMQWGGSVFAGGGEGTRQPFALATCLSTICQQLDVDVITGLSTGLPPYWGAVGHYSLATLAIRALRKGKLKAFMEANLDRISLSLETLNKKAVAGLSKNDFVPLADVPDLVFKIGPYRRPEAYENPNHFADMDKRRPSDGRSLLDICKDPEKITPAVWGKYYEEVGDESSGILPFRIWQIYKKMVEYVKDGRQTEFLCAAGILSHYVGDACQPLHISYRFNGDPDGELENGEPVSKGVHSAFDKIMVENYTDEIVRDVPAMVNGNGHPGPKAVGGGRGAAVAAVELMRRTFDLVDPKLVCDAYAQVRDQKPKQRAAALWARYRKPIEQVMADGARTLAWLWESAWEEGKGDKKMKDLGLVDEKALSKLYQDRNFLRSCNIKGIAKEL